MLCKHPYVRDKSGKIVLAALRTGNRELLAGAHPFPCGQCLPCRINKRRVWTHRMILESYMHPYSCMVTLTYDDAHLPVGRQLSKKDLQDYIKRVRYALEPRRIRYYACGEYGARTHRPHYHIIFFGVHYEADAKVLYDCWFPRGMRFHVCEANHDTIQYVAGYVTKKISKDLGGDAVPEFALMSRKPGIGYPALQSFSTLFQRPEFLKFLSVKHGVPDGLLHGASYMPFGRYLKDKLALLFDVPYDPDIFYRSVVDEFVAANSNGKTILQAFEDKAAQPIKQIEKKFLIFGGRDKL